MGGGAVGEFLNQWPPCTRYLLLLSVAIPLSVRLGIISAYDLLFSTPMLYKRMQLWRLVTPFFFCAVNLNYLHALYVRFNYSLLLERSSDFAGNGADYLFFLLFSSLCTLIGGWALGLVVFWNSMTISIVYLWSRLHASSDVSLMFGIRFKAFWLPYAMIGLDCVNGVSPYVGALGILSGHAFYFLRFVWPKMRGGRDVLKTPVFLKRAFNAPGPLSGAKTGHSRQNAVVTGAGYTMYVPASRQDASERPAPLFVGKGRRVCD